MENPIKYNTNPESLALKKGNFWIGTGDVSKGPTDVTGYWAGITPPLSGYTIYINKASNGPAIYAAQDDNQFVYYSNRLNNTSFTSATQSLSYFSTQTDRMVLNRDYEPLITSGLTLLVDAGFTPSYPRSGTTIYDLGFSGSNGTLTNGPSYSGSNGGVLVFDGIDDYLTMGSNGSGLVQGKSALTMGLLFKMTSLADLRGLIGTLNYGCGANLGMTASNTNLVFYNDTSTCASVSIPITPYVQTNNWIYAVATFDGNNSTIYGIRNGTLSQATLTLKTGSTNTFSSSFRIMGNNYSPYFTNGECIQAFVYDRALSQSEVVSNYQTLIPRLVNENIVTSGLVTYLDTGYRGSYPTSGTTWFNLSANGQNGSLVNTPLFSSNYGGAFILDGTNDFFTVSGVPTGTTYSAFLWFFYDGQTQFAIKGHRTFFATSTFRYQWDDNFSTTSASGPFLDFNVASGGINYAVFQSVTPQTPSTLFNQWHCVGFTSDGTTLKNYFNGVQVGGNVTLTKLFSTDGNLRIAYDGISGIGSADYFFETGGLNYIGPFMIYNRPLSQTEITQNYNAQKSRFGL
jgi:hypothetical protein